MCFRGYQVPSLPLIAPPSISPGRHGFQVASYLESCVRPIRRHNRVKDATPVATVRIGKGRNEQRARQSKNPRIRRYNPLEDNFRVYNVENGTRTQLGSADIPKSEGWHTLRVTMNNDHIICYLDGKKLLDVHDATFAEAGQIGLWTKADAQTNFDGLTLKTDGK